MVTKERRFSLTTIERTLIKVNYPEREQIMAELSNHASNIIKRAKKPDTPEGCILFSDASRKYKIPKSTLSDWLRLGWVEEKYHIGKFKFVSESDVARLANLERQAGKRTIEKIEDCAIS